MFLLGYGRLERENMDNEDGDDKGGDGKKDFILFLS